MHDTSHPVSDSQHEKGTCNDTQSGKRPRRDDDDDSDSSEESLEGSKTTKQPEELKAITWKQCEPVPVTINSGGTIAVNGNTVYCESRSLKYLV